MGPMSTIGLKTPITAVRPPPSAPASEGGTTFQGSRSGGDWSTKACTRRPARSSSSPRPRPNWPAP